MAFPLSLPVKPSTEAWWIENPDISGGVSSTGIEQVVSTASGRWRCKLSWNGVFGSKKVKLRGFVMGLRGRAGTVLMGPSDIMDGLPWGTDANGKLLDYQSQAHPELAGTAYADSVSLAESLLARTVKTAANLRDRSLLVTKTAGADANIGNWIGLGNSLHIVVGVSLSGSDATYSIEPPLRGDILAGSQIIMTAPVCLMRMASPTPDLSTDSDRSMTLSLEFVEVL